MKKNNKQTTRELIREANNPQGKKLPVLNGGFLLAGMISEVGCTKYRHTDATSEVVGESLNAEWTTLKKVQSVKEQAAVTRIKQQLMGELMSLGPRIPHVGVLILHKQQTRLDEVMMEVEENVRLYNQSARHTALRNNLLLFSIEGQEYKVARAMLQHVNGILDDIIEMSKTSSVKKLRKKLNEIAEFETAIPGEYGQQISATVKKLREQAREVVKKAKKANEGDALTLIAKKLNLSPLNDLRKRSVEVLTEIESRQGEIRLPKVDIRQIE